MVAFHSSTTHHVGHKSMIIVFTESGKPNEYSTYCTRCSQSNIAAECQKPSNNKKRDMAIFVKLRIIEQDYQLE